GRHFVIYRLVVGVEPQLAVFDQDDSERGDQENDRQPHPATLLARVLRIVATAIAVAVRQSRVGPLLQHLLLFASGDCRNSFLPDSHRVNQLWFQWNSTGKLW